eukprot:139615-Chlamydomonas_euryale.AAC.1
MLEAQQAAGQGRGDEDVGGGMGRRVRRQPRAVGLALDAQSAAAATAGGAPAVRREGSGGEKASNAGS